MPTYKDKEQKTWYVKCTYEDWTGEKKQKLKRGFKTEREAKAWELEFLTQKHADMTMTFRSFLEIYYADKSNEFKPSTIRNKRLIMNRHVLPYFGDLKMNEVTPAHIIQWQNKMQENDFSQAYLRMLQNQFNAVFNHAARIYDLNKNPVLKVKKMGTYDREEEMLFWTREEYEQFLSVLEPGSPDYLMAQVLFWTGMREGEMLALTAADINFNTRKIRINKTYSRIHKVDYITSPKTKTSIRTITIPKFLCKELKTYIDGLYGLPPDVRIFSIVSRTIQKRFKKYMLQAGVKVIRIHDFRHSHAAYLIHKKEVPMVIKKRLGHKDIRETMNTYGHLYPDEDGRVADMLDESYEN